MFFVVLYYENITWKEWSCDTVVNLNVQPAKFLFWCVEIFALLLTHNMPVPVGHGSRSERSNQAAVIGQHSRAVVSS